MPKLTVDRRLRSATIPPLILNQPRENLDTPERFLIGVLAMHGEVSFPARDTIADFMGCSVATVSRTIGRLTEKGWLSVEIRRGQNGRQTSNRYTLCIPDGADAACRVTATQIEARPPAQIAPPPGANCATIKDSEVLKGKREDATATVAPPAQDPGPAPIAPDIEFLKHADAEFERATGIAVVRVWARDRRLSRSIIDRCPGGMVEAKAVATRYARDGKANGWSVTLVGLLGRIDDVRQRIARSGPARRDDGTVAEHPMARMSRIDREWIAAHSGRTPASADEVVAWARRAGRMTLRREVAGVPPRAARPPVPPDAIPSRIENMTDAPRAARSAAIPPPVVGAR